MLILPITAKWFDMILNREKLEEYRAIKPYYTSRFKTIGLLNDDGSPNILATSTIVLRNGYSSQSRQVLVNVSLRIKQGKVEWGAEPGVDYYCLRIHSIEELYGTSETNWVTYDNERR